MMTKQSFLKMLNNRYSTRYIVLLLSLCLISPSISFAFVQYPATTNTASIHSVPVSKAIDLSSKIGRVITAQTGTTEKVVYYIQDLHCHYEVQKNIAAIINQLHQEHQLTLVGVEGNSQPIPLDQLRTIPDPAIREAVGDYFLARGRLTGAEFESYNQMLCLKK